MTINENIDDKALKEAGLAYAKANPFLTRADHDEAMRAAIAAAYEVRAKGWHESAKLFAVQVAQALGVKLNQLQFEMVIATLEVAFAAGLAKGEAERAALVEALNTVRVGEHSWPDVLATIDNALALVRKGV